MISLKYRMAASRVATCAMEFASSFSKMLVLSTLIMVGGPAEALPALQRGDAFVGTDQISGRSCSIRVVQDLSESIFGSTLAIEFEAEGVLQSTSVANHPLFGGHQFGKSILIQSPKVDSNGVAYALVNEFWAELEVTEDGQAAVFTYSHLGASRGGLLIGEPRGELSRCTLNKRR